MNGIVVMSGGSITLPAAPHVHRAELARDTTQSQCSEGRCISPHHHPRSVIVPSLCSLICQEEIVRPTDQQQLHLLPSDSSSTLCSHSFVIYFTLSFYNVQAEDPLFHLYFKRSSPLSIITRRLFLLPDKCRVKFPSLCVSQFFILLLLIFFLEILFIMLFFIYQDEVRRLERP